MFLIISFVKDNIYRNVFGLVISIIIYLVYSGHLHIYPFWRLIGKGKIFDPFFRLGWV